MNRKLTLFTKILIAIGVLFLLFQIIAYMRDHELIVSIKSKEKKELKIVEKDIQKKKKGRLRGKAIDSLRVAVERFVNDPELANASIGCCFAIDGNRVIASNNPHKSFIPASVLKIFTTATALEMFGEGHQLETKLEIDGSLDKQTGILNGNVYITGGGDPALGSRKYHSYYYSPNFMDKWAQELKILGIKYINGAVIADARIFDTQDLPLQWSFGNISTSYGAPAFGLSVYENMFVLNLRTNLTGRFTPSDIDITPDLPWVAFENNSTPTNQWVNNLFFTSTPYGKVIRINGQYPRWAKKMYLKGAIPDPPYLLAEQFQEKLVRNGIIPMYRPTTMRKLISGEDWYKGLSRHNELVTLGAISQKIVEQCPVKDYKSIQIPNKTTERTTVTTTLSPPMHYLIGETNTNSNNLYAEHLLRQVGLKKYNNGTASSGVSAVKSFWEGQGIDMNGFDIYDGCGMSRYDVVTPTQLVSMLLYMRDSSQYFNTFYNSLPIAGETGTIRKMWRETSVQGHVRAKSGTIRRVKGFAGYAETHSNHLVAFSILINDYLISHADLIAKLEDIMIKLRDI